MSKPQIIYQDGKPAFAVLPWKQYESSGNMSMKRN